MLFSEIMNYGYEGSNYKESDNYRVYCEILESIRNNSTIPFIGAGLSAFAHPSWLEFLNLEYSKLPSKLRINDHNDYFVHASYLLKQRTDVYFYSDLVNEFGAKKIRTKIAYH